MGKFFSWCFFLLCCWQLPGLSQGLPPGRPPATHSVLSAGTWYKVGITAGGLYKLDRSLLAALGLPVDQLDPRQLQLYGNGGALLPQLNREPRPDDLQENAVFVSGESDGRLDAPDYVLFYAPGPHRWHYDPAAGRFAHQYNIYSDTTYYYLTVGTTPGRRVIARDAPATATETIDTYHEHLYWEQDLVNVLKSGRNWYGEAFNSVLLTRNFSFPLADVVPGSLVHLTSAVMGNSEAGSFFQVEANNTLLGSQTFHGRGDYDYHAEGEADTRTFTFDSRVLAGSALQVNLTYNQQGFPSATGYLDYLEVNAERPLQLTGTQTTFRSTRFLGSGKAVAFKIRNSSPGASVWEVSDPLRPRSLPLVSANGTATFTALTDTLREYLVFAGSDFPRPMALGLVANQNLHQLNLQGQLDLVIVTHPLFKAQAEQLAQHRHERDNLEVAVVTTSQVYQEFSSGSQDVAAIRDFMKMLYGRRSPAKRLYLLLFGDASYDYKFRTPQNTNFVPVYESRQSLDPLATYSSEDFYGFLDEDEGEWSEANFSTPELLDIGIGRLPVKSVAEAEAVVNKIRHYDSAAGFGKWRNRITLVADDGDGGEHLRDAESLAQYLDSSHPAYLPKKLYLDLYKQASLPNGQQSPATNADLNKAIEQGSLILNYTGHGNETTLAHEQILTLPQIEGWRNYDRLVFMLTATCEFGRYDDPRRSSGAEAALLNPRGGAMGLLTTTRPVYASTNRLLNRNFMQKAFSPINGQVPRLGDLVVQTKNNSQAQASNRNFTLLGDPSQQLAYPDLQAEVTTINTLPVAGGVTDTLRALQQVSLTGRITDRTQALQTNFNGLVEVTIFDKPVAVKTLGDESKTDSLEIQDVLLRENIIYAGTATVQQGTWTLNFMVPKDISYHVGPGFISLYAYSATTDAQGLTQGLAIGGTSPQVPEDAAPPQIRLFMDDESFVSGGLTGPHPVLLARLSDANGINTTGIGIGHEITATLDGDKANTFVLNDFYTADRDNFQSGLVRYPFRDLALGWHDLSLKAWDTHNNGAEARIRFQVTPENEVVMAEVVNYPNPFYDHTTFRLDHNRVNEDLDIQIHIFTVTGKIVRRIDARRLASDSELTQVSWDGRDGSGAALSPGVYLYQVILRSGKDGSHTQKFNRLIKLN